MARVKFPPGAQARIERMLNERERLERRHMRALDPAMVALEAAILRAMLAGGAERPWTIREHARAMRGLRAAGQQLGAEVSHRARVAAHEAAAWGAGLQPRALAVMASAALGKRVPAPTIDAHQAAALAAETIDARTDGIGAATGDEVARAAVAASFAATRAEKVALAGMVALSLMPMVMRKARDRSERVIVTEVTAGAAEGGRVVLDGWAKRSTHMQRVWDATLDRRVCALCAGLHHVMVEASEPWPGGVDDAPAHSRCRCATMPFSADFEALLADLGIGPGPRTGVVGGVEIVLPTFSAPAPAEFVASRP